MGDRSSVLRQKGMRWKWRPGIGKPREMRWRPKKQMILGPGIGTPGQMRWRPKKQMQLSPGQVKLNSGPQALFKRKMPPELMKNLMMLSSWFAGADPASPGP